MSTPQTLGEIAEIFREWKDNEVTKAAVEFVITKVWYEEEQ